MKNVMGRLMKGLILFVVVCGTARWASATNYTWTGSAGNWTTPAQWTGGGSYPQVGDTAIFSVAGVSVAIATGAQAVDRVNVTGSGVWTWTGSTLTLGSGGFNYSNTASYGLCYASLSGIGAVTVNRGRLDLYGANTFSGGLYVRYGTLGFTNDNALGAADSPVTLGSKGKFGTLSKVAGPTDVPMNHPIVLDGAGGKLASPAWETMTVSNTISGTGRLIIAASRRMVLSNATDNTFSGGSSVQYDTKVYSLSNAFGTGGVTLEPGATLSLLSSNNVSRTSVVRVKSALGLMGVLNLANGVPPAIASDSSGIIGLNNYTTTYLYSGPEINALLASNAPTLGNGQMWITMFSDYVTFTGNSLQAGVDGVYRIWGGGSYNNKNDPTLMGVFTGTNALLVAGGGVTHVKNDNDFSGALTLMPGVRFWSYCGRHGGGVSPLGSTNGEIVLNRCGSLDSLRIENATGCTNPVIKGPLTFNSSSLISLVPRAGSPAILTVASLKRGEHATLKFYPASGFALGGDAKLLVASGAPVPTNGIVAPNMIVNAYADASMDFAAYGSGGFTTATYNATTLAGAASTSVVNLAASEGVPTGGKEVYALKTAYAVTNTDGSALTIGSGGLILAGASTTTNTMPLMFTNEAVVWTLADHYLNGKISGSGGLIKAGGGSVGTAALYLGASNDFAGCVTVNEGVLKVASDNALGNPTNVVYLNNASYAIGVSTLSTYLNAITTARQFIIGSNGGGFGGSQNWTLNGLITGAGILTFNGNVIYYVNNSSNDYSGGTVLGNGTIEVGASGRLGTGDVTVSASANNSTLRLKGESNVVSTAHIMLRQDGIGYTASGEFQAPTQTIGWVEGNGTIKLGTTSSATTLKVGGNNESFECYGDISQFSASWPGVLIKQGTGTFTYWGVNSCSGTTTVTNGTFTVNGTQGSPTQVGGSGILSGIGLIANNLQIQTGGKLAPGYLGQGILQVNGTVGFDAGGTYEVTLRGTNAASDYAQLSVSGTLNLGGVLNLVLTSAPTVGQQFTIMDNPVGTTVSGMFVSGQSVSATYGGKSYSFSVRTNGGDGNDVVLNALPRGTVISIR